MLSELNLAARYLVNPYQPRGEVQLAMDLRVDISRPKRYRKLKPQASRPDYSKLTSGYVEYLNSLFTLQDYIDYNFTRPVAKNFKQLPLDSIYRSDQYVIVKNSFVVQKIIAQARRSV